MDEALAEGELEVNGDAVAEAAGDAVDGAEALGDALVLPELGPGLDGLTGPADGEGVTCGDAPATRFGDGALGPHAARMVTVNKLSTSAGARESVITRPRTESTPFET